MKFFKVSPESKKSYPVTEKNFTEALLKNDQLNQNGKQYGVCPYCDNPVQLIGIYKKLKVSPYGRHVSENVEGVTRLNRQSYDYCPYNSHHRNYERNFRMDMVTERELNIFRLIRDNYDRVIYILKKETGLYYSNQLAREILNQVYRSEIWMYPGISEYNFPWIILYMYGPQRLYKRLVQKDSLLHQILESNHIVFEPYKNSDYDIVVAGPNHSYMDWVYSFLQHNRRIREDDSLAEYVVPVVAEQDIEEPDIRWKGRMDIQTDYFSNIANHEKSESYRNANLLEIAKEVMDQEPVIGRRRL